MPQQIFSCLTRMGLGLVVFVTALTMGTMPLYSQACAGESEPNDQPAQATAINGASCISAELGEGDQDIYRWTIDEAASRQRWYFTLQGLPTGLTTAQILRVTLAENGVDVVESTKLYEFSVQRGGTITSAPLLFIPGTYYLGLVAAGGTGAYEVEMQLTEPLPVAADQESTQDTPAPLPAAPDNSDNLVQLSGDLIGADDYFAWTVSEADAAQRWRITAQLPLGERGYLYLYDSQASQVTYREVSTLGRIDLPALGLAGGDYRIRVATGRDYTTPYLLSIQPDGARAATHEEEPNDDYQHAWPFDMGLPMKGGVAADHYDLDFYKLTVDARFAAAQWQLTATPSVPADYELCLLDDKAVSIQCRTGDGGEIVPSLTDLTFVPGEYYVTLRDKAQKGADYTLAWEEIGELPAGRENEPNDDIAHAWPFSATSAIQGRFVDYEDDYYQFTATGAAQLWRIQINGDNLDLLSLVEVDGTELMSARPNGANRLRLDDLYLWPGDHLIRVRGTDADYSVRMIPLGPPAITVTMPALSADGQLMASENLPATGTGITEREPNNGAERAERLPFDTPRSGRLSHKEDLDLYRFSLAGTEHVRLILVQPPGGRVQMDLSERFSNAERDDGSPLIYETLLGPGDYTIALDAAQPSEDLYYLLLERLNPLDLPVDLEPVNEQPAGATLLPPTLSVRGRVNNSEDAIDWYQVPTLPTATTVSTLTVNLSPGFYADVRSGESSLSAQNTDSALGIYTYTLPSADPVLIGVRGMGIYTLSVTADAGLIAQPLSEALPLTMTLSAPVAAIAGFWQQGQQLDLNLTLTNTGDTPLVLALSAVSTNFAWQLFSAPGAANWVETITLVAGESRTLPLPVKILPDVGVNLPSRFSVRATDVASGAGAFVTTTLDLPAICSVSPINPNSGWTTAGALRGGLNVAWRGLGSQPLNEQANERIFDLFDEIVSPAFGWTGQVDDRLTVALAGDEAVPVAGIMLNAFGRTQPADQLRHFELLLSADGQDFAVVHRGELVQNQIDQTIVLTQTIPARFAQVRLIDSWQGGATIGIGEFKVIAATDYQPSTVFNLLDPALGGHVVSSSPLLANQQELVSPLDEQPMLYPGEGAPSVEWVVAFHHNRAAQITTLHWRNWPDGAPEHRFNTVEIQVSTTSPVGPWQPVTTWTLDPTSVATQTLTLDAPVWARFVRYIAQPPTDSSAYEYPDTLAIDEYPLENSYRSILAEWGGNRPTAIFEEIQQIHALGSQISEVEPNDQTNAQLLAPGQPINGTTSLGQDEDWFTFIAPPNVNTLTATLRGDPAVSVDAEVLDSNGAPISHTLEITGGVLLLNVPVTPGDSYYLRIFDPKRSIVFSWDTSGSVGPYLTQIYQSMATFTQGIDPDYEMVNLLPFGDPGTFLLPDFSGDAASVQQAFNNYPRTESSSSAEANLLAATTALAARTGVRAVVLMTDAESSSYPETERLWQALSATQPRVFSFEISSGGTAYSQDLMQDWAMVNNGYYANLTTLGAFEQGFARATCFLRRPADYGVSIAFTHAAPPPTPTPLPTPMPTATSTPVATPTPAAPGALTVVGADDASSQPAQVIGGGAVELILDASGSMLQGLEGKPRIQIARDTLTNLTTNILPPGTQLVLRVFGHLEADACRTDLVIPLQPLDPASVNEIIAGIEAKNLAKTPIAASLRLVAEDLATATGQKVVVLVTDGEETCDGDPGAEIAALRAQGIDVRVNIVGFAIDDPALQATFEEWAALGGGAYFNANNAGELDTAVSQALAAPFRVLNATGVEVARGVVNGDTVDLPAGSYRVEILTEPTQQLPVTIPGGASVTLSIEP